MESPTRFLCCLILLAAFPVDGHAQASLPTEPAYGEVLVRQYNCLSCHQAASEITSKRLEPMGAPDLADLRARVSPNWLRSYLTEPNLAKPGTTMPHVLGALHPSDQKECVENLVHYLMSRGSDLATTASERVNEDIDLGQKLWDTTGCVACHGRELKGHGLESKTTVAALTHFLMDPLSVRPSGRMPSMSLTSDEARQLSTFLLKDQFAEGAGNTSVVQTTGLKYEYFEQRFKNAGDAMKGATPTRVGRVKAPMLPKVHRPDDFGFRLTGKLRAPSAGDYTFYLTSDDGSRLWIDGESVIDHDGIHSSSEKQGKRHLSRGLHDMRITMFEASGGEALELRWSGPGFEKRKIAETDVCFQSITHLPLGHEKFKVNSGKAKQGRAFFLKLRCINCHGDPEQTPIRFSIAFDDLKSTKTDCLQEKPGITQPAFHLSSDQRRLLRRTIGQSSRFASRRNSHEAIDHALALFNCNACHMRDGKGGPPFHINDSFQCAAELGDEGRMPPDLSGAGHKMRTEWLQRVLMKGASVRPYMQTRMPQFGERAMAGLAEHFSNADAQPDDLREPTFTTEAAGVGRKLVGSTGFTCVVCHSVAGQPGTGVPAIDLATCNERLRPGWFRKSLLSPDKVNPGTRMPAFWAEDAVGFDEILGGSAERQVDAIWSYLSLGDRLPLPKGIGRQAGEYDVVPVERPVGLGVFMKDVGPKTVAIGFPERVHMAFNKGAPGLARVWRGRFMDARGTWHGRAGQLAKPAGRGVISFPAVDVAAVLPSMNSLWPTDQKLRYRLRHTGPSQAEGFTVDSAEMRVREDFIPRVLQDETVLIRRLTVERLDKGNGVVACLAARGSSIEETEHGFLIDSSWHCRVRGGQPRIVAFGDTLELRVMVEASSPFIIELEMGWSTRN